MHVLVNVHIILCIASTVAKDRQFTRDLIMLIFMGNSLQNISDVWNTVIKIKKDKIVAERM